MALVLRLQDKLPFDRCSLDNILNFYNIGVDKNTRHTALSDAAQTATAFLCMFKDLSNNKIKAKSKKNNEEYDTDFDDSKKITDMPIR